MRADRTRAARDAVAILVAGVCLGCSTLGLQQRMGELSKAALRVCKQDGRRCTAAQRCMRVAVRAAEALQREREAVAAGQDAPELTVQASALPVSAEATCRAEGIGP